MLKFFPLLTVGLISQAVWSLPSFPGAQGWGAQTPGGRGGKVYVITTTASDGAGSLRAALQATGPRIIVFRVSGVINLQPQQWDLVQSNSNVTVAGQTSPGGVTLTVSGGASTLWHYAEGNYLQFHDAIFRFLRFRPPVTGEHAVTLAYANNFIFDHCDFSSGTDECIDFTHDSSFTLQWCTWTNSAVCNDCQTYGNLVAYLPTAHLTLHHNFSAHHKDRGLISTHWGDGTQPAPDHSQIELSNNVIYNCGIYTWICAEGPMPASGVYLNVVGNTFKNGPNSDAGSHGIQIGSPSQNYLSDNWDIAVTGSRTDAARGSASTETRWPMPTVTYGASAAQNYEDVLNRVGAWPRDSMTARTVRECRNGTGQFGKLDDPLITTGPDAPSDADMDGMPDFWEAGMGFDKGDPSDAIKDEDGDGYTNIEEYINDLANARLCQAYDNPVYPIPDNWSDYNPSCCKSVTVENRGPDAVGPVFKVFANNGILKVKGPYDGGDLVVFGINGRKFVSSSSLKHSPGTNFHLPPGVYSVRYTTVGQRSQSQVVILR